MNIGKKDILAKRFNMSTYIKQIYEMVIGKINEIEIKCEKIKNDIQAHKFLKQELFKLHEIRRNIECMEGEGILNLSP